MSGQLCSLESLVSLPPDLRFVVRERGGQERTIEAHKYFLARASPVFRALLYSSWGGAAPAPAPAPALANAPPASTRPAPIWSGHK